MRATSMPAPASAAPPHDARVGAYVPAGAHAPALDGLRGLAILIVMVSHFISDAGTNPSSDFDDRLYGALSTFGWIGVDLFFVLSGFLITGILCDTKGEAGYFRNFYVRRSLRIFPLYYAFLALWLVVLPAFHAWPEDAGDPSVGHVWTWTYLTNVVQALRGTLDAAPPYTAHFWSLAVEEQFYLLWPIVVHVCTTRRLVRVAAACVVLAPLVRLGCALAGNGTAAYVLMPARMDALAVGALLAVLARTAPERLPSVAMLRASCAAALVAFAGLLAFQLPEPRQSMLMQTFGHTVLAGLFASMLLAALGTRGGMAARTFEQPGMRFFGRYSYALYVFHLPVAFFLDQYLFRVPDTSPILGSRTPALLLFVLVATGVSVCVALLSWHMYEKHFLALKHHFTRRPHPAVGGGVDAPAAARVRRLGLQRAQE